MNLVNIYAISLCGAFVIMCLFNKGPILFHFALRLIRHLTRQSCFVTLKYVVYPTVLRKKSRLWALLQLIYWTGTISSNFIATSGLKTIGTRAGNIALINLLPLFLGGRLSLLADLLGIQSKSYVQIHSTCGVMVCLQAMFHTFLAIHQQGWFPEKKIQLYGILVSVPLSETYDMRLTKAQGVSSIALSVLAFLVRRWAFELFSKVHFAAAAVVFVAVWQHLKVQNSYSQLYLLVGGVSFLFSSAVRWILILFRNIKFPKIGSQASVLRIEKSNAAEVLISINRPFTVRPGMMLYLWMPGISLLSTFQSHPFFIVWWENDSDGKAVRVSLLVQKQNGFTRRLIEHPTKQFLVWIEGPYGVASALCDYNRALLVTAGIGISAQMSYIRALVEANMRQQNPCDIFVAWQLDHECTSLH